MYIYVSSCSLLTNLVALAANIDNSTADLIGMIESLANQTKQLKDISIKHIYLLWNCL